MDLNELVDKSLDGLANDEALEHIGLLIDAAGDAGSASGTDRAFLLVGELRKRDRVQRKLVQSVHAAQGTRKRFRRPPPHYTLDQLPIAARNNFSE